MVGFFPSNHLTQIPALKSSDGKESACNARDQSSITGWGGSPGRVRWQPTSVFLAGESHGQKSLAGYKPWGRRESDTTEQLTLVLLALKKAFQFLKKRPTSSASYSTTLLCFCFAFCSGCNCLHLSV